MAGQSGTAGEMSAVETTGTGGVTATTDGGVRDHAIGGPETTATAVLALTSRPKTRRLLARLSQLPARQ